MPAPPKTSEKKIIAAARRLLERHGRHGFSLEDVARAVGVRAPSLYNRFADRAALVAAVEVQLWKAMERAIAAAPSSHDPRRALYAQARAYRDFAKKNRRAYALMFDAEAERTADGLRARQSSLSPTLPHLIALVGERDALEAARVLVPFLHGFVSMELTGAFRLGGNVEAAFDYGLATILGGLKRTSA